MTATNNPTKAFERTNGLGTISFSPDLISSIINKVLKLYPHYRYDSHTIKPVEGNYYEVSICITTPTRDMYMKEIERLQKELVIVLKQSLALSCVIFLNIRYEK